MNAYGHCIMHEAVNAAESSIIKSWILKTINKNAECDQDFKNWEDLMHRYSYFKNVHKNISCKRKRTLDAEEVKIFNSFAIMKKIQNMIGEFEITDEEGYGHPALYWRIVRPNSHNDIGPLHADKWFWDLNPSWKEKYRERKDIRFGLQLRQSVGTMVCR